MPTRALCFALILIAASVSITDGAKPAEQSASHVVPVKGSPKPTARYCVEWGHARSRLGGMEGINAAGFGVTQPIARSDAAVRTSHQTGMNSPSRRYSLEHYC